MTSQGGPLCVEPSWATLSRSPLVCQTDGGSNIMRAGNKLQDFEEKILCSRAQVHKRLSLRVFRHKSRGCSSLVPSWKHTEQSFMAYILPYMETSPENVSLQYRWKKIKIIIVSPRHLNSTWSLDVWQRQPACWLIRSRNLVMCAHPH